MSSRLCIAIGLLVGAEGLPTQASEREAVEPSPARVRVSGEWMSLEGAPPGEVRLRGTLAGLEADMLLDSGSGLSVVDLQLAERLEPQLPAGTSKPAAPVGPRFVESLEVVIGAERFTLPRALVVDIAGRGTRGEICVILGRELFERFVVDLDLPNRRVALRELDGFAYSGPGETLALVRGELGDLLVEASVEDLPASRFRLDTGIRELELAPAFTRKHGLLRERTPVSQALAGDGSIAHVATLRSFTLAGQRFESVPATFPAEGSAITLDGASAGSIGADVLARFRAIVDLSRGRLHLEPAPAQASLPFPRNRLGLAIAVHADAFEVTFVAPGSPAAAAEIAPGARIVAWNGQPAGAASRAAFARCLESPAGTEVTLTDGEGSVRTLVARDYY
jgi:hypothetical protein